MTRFSIVIPLHDKGPHIERAVLSVLGQNHRDWELLVVDDASTDDGPAKVESLMAANPGVTIRLLRRDTPGPGGYAARNLGIEEARHDWVCFLDADDEWTPGYLAAVRDAIESGEATEFLSSGYSNLGRSRIATPNAYHRLHSARGAHPIAFWDYVEASASGACPAWTSAVVASKRLLQSVGAFPEKECSRGGDVDTWLRLVRAEPLYWIPILGAVYHRDAENMHTRRLAPTLDSCIDRSIVPEMESVSPWSISGIRRKRALKRLSNHYKKPAVKRLILEDQIKPRHAFAIGFAWAPGLALYALLAGLTPPFLRHAAIFLLRRLRRI